MDYLHQQFDKAMSKGGEDRKKKQAREKRLAVLQLTLKEQSSLIKEKYGLKHGGSKQNKKKKKKRRK